MVLTSATSCRSPRAPARAVAMIMRSVGNFPLVNENCKVSSMFGGTIQVLLPGHTVGMNR